MWYGRINDMARAITKRRERSEEIPRGSATDRRAVLG
jgi:hypothetical protein